MFKIVLFSLLCVTAVMLFLSSCATPISDADKARLVPRVDLERYAGLWYQVGRYPNSFQSGDCAISTAEYRLDEKGRVLVLNRCWEDRYGGTWSSQVRAVGRRADDTGSRLLVTFFKLFTANYLIIELDEKEYRWAAVSTPKKKNLWILSRTPSLPEEDFRMILRSLEEKGFDPERITRTSQQ